VDGASDTTMTGVAFDGIVYTGERCVTLAQQRRTLIIIILAKTFSPID